MSIEEVATLMSCEGQLVSMNSFLSTTRDRDYALALVESGSNSLDEIQSVLFEIDFDRNLSEMKPYADISRESAIPSEDEVLIMLGSVFRLNSVYSENDGRSWIIRISLSNDDQNEVRDLFECMRTDTENDNVLYSLACVLFKSDNLTTAERCYRRYLSEQSEDSVNAAKTYQSLDAIFQRRGEYDIALQMLNKAVHIFERTLTCANPFIAITYSTIGNLYLRKNDTKTALSFYGKVLDMFKRVHGEEHPRIAMCYNNMGAAYVEEKNFDEGLLCYQQALIIGENTLPPNHPNLAASHMNVGIVYGKLNQFDLALQHLERSLQMKILSLPPDHPDLGDTYGNMAGIYEKQDNLLEALSYYEKALAIFAKSLPPTHSKNVNTEKYIRYLKRILH